MQSFAEQVLELASRSAAWAEVYAVTEEQTPVSFEANRLRTIETKEVRGVALRVVVDGQIGFASSSRLDDPRTLVEDAVATARFGARSAMDYPTELVPEAPLELYDDDVVALSADEMVQMGQKMVDRVRRRGQDILCDADVRKEVVSVSVMNSSGGGGSYRLTVVSAGLHANRVRGTDILDVYESASSCHLKTLNINTVMGAVGGKLDLAEEVVPIRTANLPVIFTPKGVAMTLLNPFQAALNGKLVQQGASPFAGHLGEAMFDPSFCLYDDGRVPNVPSSAPCDGEGVPTQRTALIEDGRVNAFYYDLQTAGLAGTKSTGNGERSLGSMPTAAIHALRIKPGKVSYQDMLADMEEGLVVDQTMGADMGNILAGEFSGNVHLGFRVEGGRLVGRVKDTMVSGNVFRALGQIGAIGDRAYWVGGVFEVPYLYFPALSVSTRG